MSDPTRFETPSSLRSNLARRHGGWLAAASVLVSLTAWACGDSGSGGGGGLGGEAATSASSSKSTGGTKTTSTTATTATNTTQTASTTSGPMLGCMPPAVAPSNGMCVTLTGGTTTTASSSSASGSGSGGGGGGSGSSTAGSSTSGGGSSSTGGGVECNPVTNEPCDAGDACDANEAGGFSCFGPPNDSLVCEACDLDGGPFCAGGATCGDGLCIRFCCTDADCGDVTCVTEDNMGGALFPAAPGLGLCPPM